MLEDWGSFLQDLCVESDVALCVSVWLRGGGRVVESPGGSPLVDSGRGMQKPGDRHPGGHVQMPVDTRGTMGTPGGDSLGTTRGQPWDSLGDNGLVQQSCLPGPVGLCLVLDRGSWVGSCSVDPWSEQANTTSIWTAGGECQAG